MLTNSQFLSPVINSADTIANELLPTQSLGRTISGQPLVLQQALRHLLPTQDFQHFRRPELAEFYAVVLSRGGRIGC
ncbi:hypothetical protein [Pantanalinema sp. GBBB05]|uniref:hypothetical protein n=1 Tax=Pantanalinema sp. GBBB05 TaxID=2604139 RepID=UPI001D40BC99|nr:hypothetical protein [Pantanalinema sp. GBBB05]